MKPPLDGAFNPFWIRFHGICDCSDNKRAIRFQSGLAKNPIFLVVSLNAPLTVSSSSSSQTHTYKTQTHIHAHTSSLSPSGSLLNPYCLFSPLTSPRDRSRRTGRATSREAQREQRRGGGVSEHIDAQSPTDRHSRELVGWLATGGLLMGTSGDGR